MEPRLIVIEVLSPTDSYSETQRLTHDYVAMGVQNILLIDPETRTGRICRGDAWVETTRFQVADRPIYLDLNDLFTRLAKYSKS